jgi:hypothetical protein
MDIRKTEVRTENDGQRYMDRGNLMNIRKGEVWKENDSPNLERWMQ